VTSIQDRLAGALEVLKKHPEIKILSQDQNAGGSRDGGLRVMSDLLTAFPKIDAVFGVNDPTAIGCELAASQAKRKDFFIVDHFRLGFHRPGLSLQMLIVHIADSVATGVAVCRLMSSLLETDRPFL